MFHIINQNTIYDLANENKIEISIYKKKDEYNVGIFLDDISIWMDKNREIVEEKYLPLSILSVGINPDHVSAFLYGLFVGKALEKHDIIIKEKVLKISRDKMLKDIQKRIDLSKGVLGDNIIRNPKEETNDGGKENP
jgi:hypothetical protein